MSKGFTNTSGGKKMNFPFQQSLLLINGAIQAAAQSGATEATLQLVLTAIQNGQDYEAKLVRDSDTPAATWLEVRIYDPQTSTWAAPVYYPAGSIIPGSPVMPVVYLDPTTILSTIAVNTTGINLEATQLLVKAKTDNIDAALTTLFGTLGQKTAAGSAPVTLSDENVNQLAAMVTDLAAIEVLLTGQSRVPSVVTATVDGSTTGGVKSVSLWFRGGGGTLDGSSVPGGTRTTFSADDNDDTVASIAYTVPTGGAQEIIITYLT